MLDAPRNPPSSQILNIKSSILSGNFLKTHASNPSTSTNSSERSASLTNPISPRDSKIFNNFRNSTIKTGIKSAIKPKNSVSSNPLDRGEESNKSSLSLSSTNSTLPTPQELSNPSDNFPSSMLEPAANNELIFSPPNKQGVRNIVAATPGKLIEVLTTELDEELMVDLFLTYRNIWTPIQFGQMLIDRFLWCLEGNSANQLVGRIRTFVIMRYWITHYYTYDFAHSPALRFSITGFFNQIRYHPTVQKSPRDARIVKTLRQALHNEREHCINELNQNRLSNSSSFNELNLPNSHLNKRNSRRFAGTSLCATDEDEPAEDLDFSPNKSRGNKYKKGTRLSRMWSYDAMPNNMLYTSLSVESTSSSLSDKESSVLSQQFVAKMKNNFQDLTQRLPQVYSSLKVFSSNLTPSSPPLSFNIPPIRKLSAEALKFPKSQFDSIRFNESQEQMKKSFQNNIRLSAFDPDPLMPEPIALSPAQSDSQSPQERSRSTSVESFQPDRIPVANGSGSYEEIQFRDVTPVRSVQPPYWPQPILATQWMGRGGQFDELDDDESESDSIPSNRSNSDKQKKSAIKITKKVAKFFKTLSRKTSKANLKSNPSMYNVSEDSISQSMGSSDHIIKISPNLSLPNLCQNSPVTRRQDPNYRSFVLDYKPEDIVHQLCLVERRLLKRINWYHLAQWAKQKPAKVGTGSNITPEGNHMDNHGGPVVRIIERFNLGCQWVATEIISTPTPEDRSKVIEKFIRIAKICLELENYSSLLQILLGLELQCVTRLLSTWCRVGEAERQILIDLKQYSSPLNNWKRLRAKMRQKEEVVGWKVSKSWIENTNSASPPQQPSNPLTSLLPKYNGNNKVFNYDKSNSSEEPVPFKGSIPFLGLYLSDLVYIAELSSYQTVDENASTKSSVEAKMTSNSVAINIHKLRLQAKVIRQVLTFKNLSNLYPYFPNVELYPKLLFLRAYSNEEMDWLSGLCE